LWASVRYPSRFQTVKEAVATFDGDGNFTLNAKGGDSPNGAIDSDIELEFDEVDKEKKLPTTRHVTRNEIRAISLT
jgi:hypothetical protein